MIFYWYCKEKFYLGHSWEKKGLKRKSSGEGINCQPKTMFTSFWNSCFLKIHIRYVYLFFSHQKGDGLGINISHRRRSSVLATVRRWNKAVIVLTCKGLSPFMSSGSTFLMEKEKMLKLWIFWKQVYIYILIITITIYSNVIGEVTSLFFANYFVEM